MNEKRVKEKEEKGEKRTFGRNLQRE